MNTQIAFAFGHWNADVKRRTKVLWGSMPIRNPVEEDSCLHAAATNASRRSPKGKMRMKTNWIAAGCLLLVLAACGNSEGSDRPAAAPARSGSVSPSPTATAVVAASYDSVVELKDAAVKAGYTCASWKEDDKVTLATESGTCSDADVFTIFDRDSTNLHKQVQTYKEFQQEAASAGIDPSSILVGPNWIINGDPTSLAILGVHIGGDIIDGPAASAAPAPTFHPNTADWKVGVKILKKHCFGSAGCNITFRIKPSYVGTQDLPDEGTIEVTYKVSGDESGPVINTFTVESGQASYDSEEYLSTPSSSTRVAAKVTDVSYDNK